MTFALSHRRLSMAGSASQARFPLTVMNSISTSPAAMNQFMTCHASNAASRLSPS